MTKTENKLNTWPSLMKAEECLKERREKKKSAEEKSKLS